MSSKLTVVWGHMFSWTAICKNKFSGGLVQVDTNICRLHSYLVCVQYVDIDPARSKCRPQSYLFCVQQTINSDFVFFLISLLTSKRKTYREWWTDNELVYELTFRPCRVDVYILQGRCLYTAHRTWISLLVRSYSAVVEKNIHYY
jgi:hypothetical protein